jgi:hypothetical protein
MYGDRDPAIVSAGQEAQRLSEERLRLVLPAIGSLAAEQGEDASTGIEMEENTVQLYDRKELKKENIEVTKFGMAAGSLDRLWNGTVSLRNRIFSNELDQEGVNQAFGKIKDYIVIAWRNARARCVDGRPEEEFISNPKTLDRDLGPQTAGGTAGAAVCLRLAQGPPEGDTFEELTFEQDMEKFDSEIQALGFTLGAHTDDHASESMTGCGAIDKMVEIIHTMTDTRLATRMKQLTTAILGDMYDTKIYSEILGNAILMQSESESYFQNYQLTILQKLKDKAANSVSKLVGKHNEAAVIVNRIYGTTFDRDNFSLDHDNKIQAFNYDFWRSVELTETLVTRTAQYQDTSDKRKITEAKKILTARVMYTLATLMTLTDGTLDLYVLDEKDEQDNVVNLFDDFSKRERRTPTAVLPQAA